MPCPLLGSRSCSMSSRRSPRDPELCVEPSRRFRITSQQAPLTNAASAMIWRFCLRRSRGHKKGGQSENGSMPRITAFSAEMKGWSLPSSKEPNAVPSPQTAMVSKAIFVTQRSMYTTPPKPTSRFRASTSRSACSAMSGNNSRIPLMEKGALRMLCVMAHFGSSVATKKRPESPKISSMSFAEPPRPLKVLVNLCGSPLSTSSAMSGSATRTSCLPMTPILNTSRPSCSFASMAMRPRAIFLQSLPYRRTSRKWPTKGSPPLT
mmetsp:Transcript_89385/g.208094  ORF Transcript_89385/g.208094 Transcript_89385/m.208094 type:complete len:264 (-) Transcript_89385:146-937(-)